MARRLIIFALVAVVAGLYLPSAIFAQEKIKIGILRYSDELGFPEGQSGILDQLKKEGFDASNVVFYIRNAEGSKDKATEIAKEFKAKGVNLIMALGTPALAQVYKETKDIPIVCAVVFDPVVAGAAKSWESSGTNVTGSSSWVDMSAIAQTLRQVAPVKSIGVLYNEEEPNTVRQLEDFKRIQGKMGFTTIGANVAKPDEAGEVTRSLVGRVDSIFISGSTAVSKGLPSILEEAIKAKIATAAHAGDKTEKGVLVTIYANPYKLGELAGKKAAQVLRGTKPTDIPIESLKAYDIGINLKTAKAMEIKIPVKLLKAATKVVE